MKEINNALPSLVFKELQEYILGCEIPWYHNESIAYPLTGGIPKNIGVHEKESIELTKKLFAKGMTKEQLIYNTYSTHLVYASDRIFSAEVFEKLQPLIDLINPKALIRIKINNYPRTPFVVHHQDHIDNTFKHNGALFYVNTNNGVTVVEKDTEIASVENKLVLFDSSEPHHSTSSSDVSRRITININYF